MKITRKIVNISSIIFIAVLNQGCSTLFSSRYQNINVITENEVDNKKVYDLNCVATNPMGRWSFSSHSNTMIQSSYSDVNIECNNDEFEGATKISSQHKPIIWANILLTYIAPFALAADFSNGSGFKYPENIGLKVKAKNKIFEEKPSGEIDKKVNAICKNEFLFMKKEIKNLDYDGFLYKCKIEKKKKIAELGL